MTAVRNVHSRGKSAVNPKGVRIIIYAIYPVFSFHIFVLTIYAFNKCMFPRDSVIIACVNMKVVLQRRSAYKRSAHGDYYDACCFFLVY